jgi:hypothetical protein
MKVRTKRDKALEEMSEALAATPTLSNGEKNLGFLLTLFDDEYDWCTVIGWQEEYQYCGGGRWWEVFKRIETFEG